MEGDGAIESPPQVPPTRAHHGEFIPLSFIVFAIVGGQIAFYFWKRRSPRSYHRITLLLLWVFPFIVSLAARYWRFLIVWTVFSALTCLNLYLAIKGNLGLSVHKIPRRVYRWFSTVHRVSYAAAVAGYFLIIIEIFGFNPFPTGTSAYWGTMLLFYGLYFGVLGRDSAELSTYRMALRMGLLVRDGIPLRTLPPNQCGVCGEDYGNKEIITLDCTHRFHGQCIRGWALLGKKDTCPFCREKVDIKTLIPSAPWEADNTIWAHLLDAVRFSVAWTPILAFIGLTVSRLVK